MEKFSRRFRDGHRFPSFILRYYLNSYTRKATTAAGVFQYRHAPTELTPNSGEIATPVISVMPWLSASPGTYPAFAVEAADTDSVSAAASAQELQNIRQSNPRITFMTIPLTPRERPVHHPGSKQSDLIMRMLTANERK